MAVEPITDHDRVHVWFTDLDKLDVELAHLSLLSASELARAARLKNRRERQRFIASHVFTRRVLGNITGILPESLEFHKDECGKPRLGVKAQVRDGPSRSLLSFNVSHSENILAMAAGRDCEVGIDVEVVNPNLDVLAIAQAGLEHADYDLVRSSTIGERALVFYRAWTRKEAFAKMQGHGVASDHTARIPALPWFLHSFEFALGRNRIVSHFSCRTPMTWLLITNVRLKVPWAPGEQNLLKSSPIAATNSYLPGGLSNQIFVSPDLVVIRIQPGSSLGCTSSMLDLSVRLASPITA